jgi:hypothetical protein
VKLIYYEDMIMAPLNGTAGVLSFLAHSGGAPAAAMTAWGGADSAAVWDLRSVAALVRAANISDFRTTEWYVDARSSPPLRLCPKLTLTPTLTLTLTYSPFKHFIPSGTLYGTRS